MSNKISPEIRALPIYVEAFAAGEDVGLVYALTVLVAEQNRLADTAAEALASGALLRVQRIIGREFRR